MARSPSTSSEFERPARPLPGRVGCNSVVLPCRRRHAIYSQGFQWLPVRHPAPPGSKRRASGQGQAWRQCRGWRLSRCGGPDGSKPPAVAADLLRWPHGRPSLHYGVLGERGTSKNDPLLSSEMQFTRGPRRATILHDQCRLLQRSNHSSEREGRHSPDQADERAWSSHRIFSIRTRPRLAVLLGEASPLRPTGLALEIFYDLDRDHGSAELDTLFACDAINLSGGNTTPFLPGSGAAACWRGCATGRTTAAFSSARARGPY